MGRGGEIFVEMQKHEAGLHWERTNYFLVAMSLLLLVLSQLKDYRAGIIVIKILGLVLSVNWFLVNDRSSRYIHYWKEMARGQADTRNIFPTSIGGIEMRHLSYVIPVAFFLLWCSLLAF